MDFDLNNKDSKSITSGCWEGASCEPHKDLKQMPPNEIDVNILIQDDFKLRMVSLLSDGEASSNEHIIWRQQQLISTFVDSENEVSEEESSQLRGLLTDYHEIFSLNDEEHGEMDFLEFKIDTGDALPRRQPAVEFLFLLGKR